MRRTQPPQSVPALQAEAIWRGVQAPFSACCLTWASVMPKQLQTHTRTHLPTGSLVRAFPFR